MDATKRFLERLTSLGHAPTKPLKSPIGNGKRGWLLACERCELFATIDTSGKVAGPLATTKCGQTSKQAVTKARPVKNKPARQAAPKPTPTQRTIKQLPPIQASDFKADPNAIPLQPLPTLSNLPGSIPICEYCGNGTTIVGRSCKHCQQSKELLDRLAKPARFYGAQTDPKTGKAIVPQTIKYEGRQYVLATFDNETLTAPCGHTVKQRAVYVPEGYKPKHINATFIYRYPCPCATTIPEHFDGLSYNAIHSLTSMERQPDPLAGKLAPYYTQRKLRWLQTTCLVAAILLFDPPASDTIVTIPADPNPDYRRH